MGQTEESMKTSLVNRRCRDRIGCVIMASGRGMRFGSNKLLAKFDNVTLFERVLDLTDGIFAKRVVVTRSAEVEAICRERKIEVIFHDFPDRNDTVRLGVEYMEGMDGCIFCPCDQPLLTRKSIEKLAEAFCMETETIFRLAYGERDGAPVLFAREHFDELAALPRKKGGGYLAKKYPQQVYRVQAETEYELCDIDTVSDLEYLERILKKDL